MGHKKTVQVARLKQEERERQVSEIESLLGLQSEHPEDEQYTCARPEVMVDNLKNRKEGWTAERVMVAFIRAACAAQRKTNCLTEVLFREALDEAKRLDKEFFETGKAEGDFWGLPSSFKDTFNIKGVDSSIGVSPYCFQPTEDASQEGALVKLFRAAGGIPFCKTNIPQTLLSFECKNPIFDGTTNPTAADRTCGGSSGGEGAIIALKGTPMGWGSDIGGSLRIPAHYCGIYTLKPVTGRWPSSGGRASVRGFEGIKAVVGPMARSVDDLIFASRIMLNLAQQSSVSLNGEQLLPIPWREVEVPKKLRVGYFTDDHAIKASPACVRAVLESVQVLEKSGHEVIQFDPPDVPEALKIFAGLTSSDGYKTLLSNLGSDPMEASMRLTTLGAKYPRWLHRIVTWLIAKFTGDQLYADVFGSSKPKTVTEYWQYVHKRNVYSNNFRKLVWEEKKFDTIICPVQAVPALRHDETEWLSPLCIGTVLFNVVDSTVGVLPITRVNRDLDALPADYLKDSKGSKLLEKRVYIGKPGKEDPTYDAEKMHGLPVGVQVVGKAWEEEKVLKMMKVLDNMLQYEP
ncbi:hypothetical protein I312_106077 [Cryptococcus bacillisporus CA1280]|uniref:amidase n=1 Tax=Cryptococcus bacillisporus CA1280 TaxID=1296109 RepID=A0A0D0VE75_CRYGA|nr:amidase [Cryptococcus bacillisporus CA1280]